MSLRGLLTLARLRSAVLPAACWAWTRGVLMLYVFNIIPYFSHSDITADVHLYDKWSNVLAGGHFPQHDPTWQYPPGAAIVIEVPRAIRYLTGVGYYSGFYALALASDLVVFLLVVYRCWRTSAETKSAKPDYVGAYAYVASIFMLGPFVFGRYDIVVTMLAALGLALAVRTVAWTWRLRGLAIGLGSIVKVWPMALIFGLPRGANGRRAFRWAVVAGLIPTLALLLMPGALSFLTQQHDRGLEIESVLAAPFMLARRFGYHGVIQNRYGSWEIIGPGITVIATFCELLTFLGFCWLLWWRRRARLTAARWTEGMYYDAALVAVMISIITSRVLSPQYLVWVCSLLALCLSLAPLPKERGGTVLAGPCWLLLGTISITQLEFPLWFARLVHGSMKVAVFVTARDLLLVVATAWAARLLWRNYAQPEQPPENLEALLAHPLVEAEAEQVESVELADPTPRSPARFRLRRTNG